MFRHTFATELAKHDLNLYNIASILGHSNINTTKIYLSFQVDPIKQKLNSVNLFDSHS
jgi:site-specific recombinase XerD